MAISLASIQKGGDKKPPIYALHGTPGIGKSTHGAQSPAPIFVRAEDGMGLLQADAFPVAQSWNDVMEAMGLIYNESHQYNTVVIDSLSALETLIHQQVAKDNNKKSIEDIPYGRGFGMALDYWQQFLQGIIALRDHKKMMPIMIAHSDIVRYDSPECEPYERFLFRLHKKAFHLIYERADIIGFANWRTMVVKDDVGFNQKQSRGIGTGERLLHLVEKPAYIAKNRYNLPETIPLSWDAFSAALSAAFPAPVQNPEPKTNPKT